jgi:hypothetical protein
MKAITVKYIPATNPKDTRLKAFDVDGNQVTVSRNQWPNLDGQELCHQAAIALCYKMDWTSGFGKGAGLVGGAVKNGYVFCFKHQ